MRSVKATLRAEELLRRLRAGEGHPLNWIIEQVARIEGLYREGFDVDGMFEELVDVIETLGGMLGDYPGLPVVDPEVKVSIFRCAEYLFREERTSFLEEVGWDFAGVCESTMIKIAATAGDFHVFCHVCRVMLWLKEI